MPPLTEHGHFYQLDNFWKVGESLPLWDVQPSAFERNNLILK